MIGGTRALPAQIRPQNLYARAGAVFSRSYFFPKRNFSLRDTSEDAKRAQPQPHPTPQMRELSHYCSMRIDNWLRKIEEDIDHTSGMEFTSYELNSYPYFETPN